MIGVLAVIAILAGMLIPKIFEAIRNSRINATLEAYNTLKAAALDNYAKWGRFASNNLPYTGTEFDNVLFIEGRIDAKASDKIPLTVGSATNIYLSVTTGIGNGSSGYDLDGNGSADTTNAAAVVELVIGSVSGRDARDLSLRLDGPSMSATDDSSADSKGRVEYAAPSGNPKATTVYMYITHQ